MARFNLLYLLPIAGGLLLLAALALRLLLARRAGRKSSSAADCPPSAAGGPAFGDSGEYASLGLPDSQRTASSLFTGSSRGRQPPGGAPSAAGDGGWPPAAHDYALPAADADALYAVLTRDAALAGRRVSFAKIAFGASARARSPSRRVWLSQYEGDELDVTQLVLVAPPSASAGSSAAVTSPRGLRGLSSSSSSASAWSPTAAAAGPLPRAAVLAQLQQFVREIRLLGALRHPHVVPLVGVAWSALSSLSLLTEPLPAGDLRVALRRHRRDAAGFSWRARKLRIALGVARALAYLHSQRLADPWDPDARLAPVAVRGLRASRVALTRELRPVLADLSAAAGVDRDARVLGDSPEALAAGAGDAFWLAPEVLSGGGSRGDPAADVFAFGVLLGELDSGGRAPYHRELRRKAGDERPALRPFQVLHAVASGRLRPELRADCPRAVRALAAVCTALEPRDRPTAAGVCDLLLAAERELEAEAAEPAAQPTGWAGGIV